jgi:hypothetical protein
VALDIQLVDVGEDSEGGGGGGSSVQRYGCVIGLFPSDARFLIEVRRAEDLAGAPNVATIASLDAQIRPSERTYVDFLTPGTGPFHYATRHVPGGPWSCWRGPVSPVPLSGTETVAAVMPEARERTTTATTLGTLILTIDDPQCRLVQVRMKSRAGAAAETAYAVVAIAGGVYTGTVALAPGLDSTITYELTFYNAVGVLATSERVVSFSVGMANDATFLTADDERASLPNSLRLVDGANSTVTRDDPAGTIQVDVDLAPVDGGTSTGRPANWPLTLRAGPPLRLYNVPAEFTVWQNDGWAWEDWKYCNLSEVESLRVQGGSGLASGGGVQLVLAYSTNGGASWSEAGPFFALDVIRHPALGDWVDAAALPEALLADNVLLGWGTKGGDGSTVVQVGNIYVDAVSSAERPASDPSDPLTPEGGDLGDIIIDWDSLVARDAGVADGTSINPFEDASPNNNDGVPWSPSPTQVAPVFRTSGFGGGSLPRLTIASGQGLTSPRISVGEFTVYMNVASLASSGGTVLDGANLMSTQGDAGSNGVWRMRGDGTFVGMMNGSAFGTTWLDDCAASIAGGKHTIAIVWERASGTLRFYVDGVLDSEQGDSSYTNAWVLVTRMYWFNTVGATNVLTGDVGRLFGYNKAHDDAGVAEVTASQALIWGTG